VRGAAGSFAKSTTEHLQAQRPQKTEQAAVRLPV
jgi:hypothetical protein